MICPRCGTINADEGERCKRCQGSLAPPPTRPAVASDRDPSADQVPSAEPEATADPTVGAAVGPLTVHDPERPPSGPPASDGDDRPAEDGRPMAGDDRPPTPEVTDRPPAAGDYLAPSPAPWGAPPLGGPPHPDMWGTQQPPPPPGSWGPQPQPPPGSWGTPPPYGWPPPGDAPGGWSGQGGWGPPQGPVARDQEGRRGSIPTYLVQAILCAVIFNVLAGVVAIAYSVQVNRKLAAGDWNGATRASRLARIWCWVSVAIGVVFLTLILSGSIGNPYS